MLVTGTLIFLVSNKTILFTMMSPRVNDSANAGAELLSSIVNPISRMPLSVVTFGLILILSGGPVTAAHDNCNDTNNNNYYYQHKVINNKNLKNNGNVVVNIVIKKLVYIIFLSIST